jgi:dihydrofolate reductase
MRVTAIAAVARNGVIGVAGGMPWNIPQDFARFRRVTMGSYLIMGRKTFQSIGAALPGRVSVVVSRSAPAKKTEEFDPAPGGRPTRVVWVDSLDAAFDAVDDARPVFVGGGAQIYRAAWSRLTDLDVTEVDSSPEGDAFFPEIAEDEWTKTWREPHDGFTFARYTRAALPQGW